MARLDESPEGLRPGEDGALAGRGVHHRPGEHEIAEPVGKTDEERTFDRAAHRGARWISG